MKYKSGDKVRVIDNNNSHGFKIGEEVTIVEFEYSQTCRGQYICVYKAEREGDYWHVLEPDIELASDNHSLKPESSDHAGMIYNPYSNTWKWF